MQLRWGDLNFEKNFKINSEPILQKGMGFCFSPLTTYALRLRVCAMPYALCALQLWEVNLCQRLHLLKI